MDPMMKVLIIVLPTIVAVLSIIGIFLIIKEEIRDWITGLFRRKEVDYNATPIAGYEPVRRWSDSTFTSVPLQSNRTTADMPILPPAALNAVVLASSNSSADVATGAPTGASWQARQQERVRLNDASLRPMLPQQTRNSSRPAKPTFIRNSRSPGPDKVQASTSHSGRPRSRASSISETELRDLQAAFAFVEEQEQEENKIRVCRSLEMISRNAGTKLTAGAAGR